MRVQVTFRSGAQAVVDVERLQVTHDGPSGGISRIQWDDATIGDRLLGIVPAEVVCVVELDAQPAPGSHLYLGMEHPSHIGTTCEQYHERHEADGVSE